MVSLLYAAPEFTVLIAVIVIAASSFIAGFLYGRMPAKGRV